MKIVEALKRGYCRVGCEHKWLIWDSVEWIVYTYPYKSSNPKILYSGENEEEAVKILLQE